MAACRGGNNGLVAHLIGRGANNWDGGLLAAVKGGHEDIARTMINCGADANTGMMAACRDKKYNIVRALLDHGARCPKSKCECNDMIWPW